MRLRAISSLCAASPPARPTLARRGGERGMRRQSMAGEGLLEPERAGSSSAGSRRAARRHVLAEDLAGIDQQRCIRPDPSRAAISWSTSAASSPGRTAPSRIYGAVAGRRRGAPPASVSCGSSPKSCEA